MEPQQQETGEGGLSLTIVAVAGFCVVTVAVVAAVLYKAVTPVKPHISSAPHLPVQQMSKPRKLKRRSNAAEKSVKLLFGSQTGTAEEFAKMLKEEGQGLGLSCEVVDLEEFTYDDLKEEKLLVFLVSTYGDGEPTDNAKEFYDALMEQEDPELEDLHFAVFGLGNKTYQHFNAVSKGIHKKLLGLGAQSLFRLGEGDDDANLEDDFLQWKKGFWPVLCAFVGIPYADTASVVKRRMKLVEGDDLTTLKIPTTSSRSAGVERGFDAKAPIEAVVVENRELYSADSDRSCRHLELDTSASLLRSSTGSALTSSTAGSSEVTYDPGDHVAVLPQNDPELVAAYAQRLNVSLDKSFALITAEDESGKVLLGPCTVKEALTSLFDLTTPPRKNLLKGLSDYFSDDAQRKEFDFLCSDDGNEKFNNWVSKDQRTVLEVLEHFTSCHPPFDHLFELLPRLQPRYYSISSARSVHKQRVHITAAVVEYRTPTGRLHRGICTSYLSSLPLHSKVKVFFRRSTFHLPKKNSTPIIMIGPGTGLAPFRGFLYQRAFNAANNLVVNLSSSSASVSTSLSSSSSSVATEGAAPSAAGVNLLFFGCRHEKKDYLYREELEKFVAEGYLQLSLAFSRDQAEKIYVSTRLREKAEEIARLINSEGATVYICGDAKSMAKDVQKILEDIIGESNFKKLSSSSRLLMDVW